ncbi:hypothetical protein PTTG_03268 [Puccinia triticina 1-1 BBBD Race 1]|uniref:Uncharacterized protein n=1 Tax=Puccinia triticina (isolate 1-1 / race 1 (BBBD)) TaxID=630390 RepID=A0A180GHR7_PUCT1|nr:hypothetical protein PTTG_03268 [Puccinia triticina 1-1 BBBD Race 1]
MVSRPQSTATASRTSSRLKARAAPTPLPANADTLTGEKNVQGRSTAASDHNHHSLNRLVPEPPCPAPDSTQAGRSKLSQTVSPTEPQLQNPKHGWEEGHACSVAPDNRKTSNVIQELNHLFDLDEELFVKAGCNKATRLSIEQPPPQATSLVTQGERPGIRPPMQLPKNPAAAPLANPPTRQKSPFRFNAPQEDASQITFESAPTQNSTQDSRKPVRQTELDAHGTHQSNGAEGRINATEKPTESVVKGGIDSHDSQESSEPLDACDLVMQDTQDSQEDSHIENLLKGSEPTSPPADQSSQPHGDLAAESIGPADESEPAGPETQDSNEDLFVAANLTFNAPEVAALESGLSSSQVKSQSTTSVSVDPAKESPGTPESNAGSQTLDASINLPTHHAVEPARSYGDPLADKLAIQAKIPSSSTKHLSHPPSNEPVKDDVLAVSATEDTNGETGGVDFPLVSNSTSNYATYNRSAEPDRSSGDQVADNGRHSELPNSSEVDGLDAEETNTDTQLKDAAPDITLNNVDELEPESEVPPQQRGLRSSSPLYDARAEPDSPGHYHRSTEAHNELHQVHPLPSPDNDDPRVSQDGPPNAQHSVIPPRCSCSPKLPNSPRVSCSSWTSCCTRFAWLKEARQKSKISTPNRATTFDFSPTLRFQFRRQR